MSLQLRSYPMVDPRPPEPPTPVPPEPEAPPEPGEDPIPPGPMSRPDLRRCCLVRSG